MIMIPSQERRMEAQYEALAAWVDGEPVARTDVALALETREGRDYVLDLMALRRMVDATTPTLAAKATPRSARPWPRFAAAAAAIVLCAAGGFAAGRLATPIQMASPGVPDAAVVPISSPAPVTAPAPTRVIRLDEGTSWRENGGS
jgi:hypothetical protein